MTINLGTDSGEYEILRWAAEQTKDVDGLSIELGIREGGGSQHMIEPMFDSTARFKTHIGIDPYGSLPYEWKEGEIAGWVYDNTMRNNAIINLFRLTNKTNVNFLFYCMTDTQFFEKFADGVPIFIAAKQEIINTYSIVHFDAVHSKVAVQEQVAFFMPRTVSGSMFVFDDVEGFYDHESIEKELLINGWTVARKGHKKAAYAKS